MNIKNYYNGVSQNKPPMNMVTKELKLTYFTTYITTNEIKIINTMGSLTTVYTNANICNNTS